VNAVNLIPADERRGSARIQGAGNGVYVALGGLAVAVVAVALYVVTGNTVTERQAQLAQVTQQAQATAAAAAQAAPYRSFAQLRQARIATVRQIADSRFNWSDAFYKVAQVLPRDVWLTSLSATVRPGISIPGGGTTSAGGSSLRGSLANPAIEMLGCTTGQDEVARVMARLRLIDTVSQVSLQSSTKLDPAPKTGAAAATSGTSTADCRYGHVRYPQFSLVIFFNAPPALASATGAPASAAGANSAPTAPSTTAPSTASTGTTATASARGSK
jgi:Tfp pilus assembly protein PilN